LLDQFDAGAEYAFAVFDQQGVRNVLAYGGEVMADHDDGSTLVMPGVDVLPEQLLAKFVEGGMGFVEEQNRGVGQAQSGEQGAL
jgi:hypothetical protein